MRGVLAVALWLEPRSPPPSPSLCGRCKGGLGRTARCVAVSPMPDPISTSDSCSCPTRFRAAGDSYRFALALSERHPLLRIRTAHSFLEARTSSSQVQGDYDFSSFRNRTFEETPHLRGYSETWARLESVFVARDDTRAHISSVSGILASRNEFISVTATDHYF